ncbi:MAG: hypothetical protein E7342_00715 [Clostridiales bacterium]|nr:hypothetical protein [Clostridiales bacterium]
MKKGLLGFLAIVVVLMTAVSMYFISFSTSSYINYKDYVMSFESEDWLKEGEDVYSFSNGERNNTKNWNRTWYGQEIRKENGEQYMYLYDADKDMLAVNEKGESDLSYGGESSFYYLTNVITEASGKEDPLKIKLTVCRDGEGWFGDGGCLLFRIGFFSKNSLTMTEEEFALYGFTKEDFEDGWYYFDFTNKVNKATEKDWFNIDAEFSVPEFFNNTNEETGKVEDYVKIQFKYSDGATEEVEDVALKIKDIILTAPSTVKLISEKGTFDFRKPTDVAVQIDMEKPNVQKVYFEGVARRYLLGSNAYYLEDNKVVFKKEYLETLNTGDNKFVIVVDGAECNYTIDVKSAILALEA